MSDLAISSIIVQLAHAGFAFFIRRLAGFLMSTRQNQGKVCGMIGRPDHVHHRLTRLPVQLMHTIAGSLHHD
jgi:hypothetical protein